jgi:hypothetical protein
VGEGVRWCDLGGSDLGLDGFGQASTYGTLHFVVQCQHTVVPRLHPQHEGVGHGGGGILLRRSWSAGWLWSAASWEGVAAGENRAPTMVMVADCVVLVLIPC